MPNVVEYVGKKGKEAHYVYPRAEADREGIPYVEKWREVEREGQWVLTDDGYVVEALAISKMRGGSRTIRTCTGTFLISPSIVLDTKPRESRYTLNGIPVNRQPFRMTDRIEVWARLYANGMNPFKAFRQVFGGSSTAHAERRIHYLLRQREVMDVVKDELDSLLKKLGIDEEFILKNFKELAEDADNDNARIAATKALANIVGLMKPREPASSNVFLGFQTEELKQLEKGDPVPAAPVRVVTEDDDEVEGIEDQEQEE